MWYDIVFTYNLEHNIFELFNILAKFLLTTIKVVLGIYYNKHAASQVGKQLIT